MNRREFVARGGALAALPIVTYAQAEDQDSRAIGVILQGGPWHAVVEGLIAGLQQNGKEEHRRLQIRDTRGDLDAVENHARAFEQEKAALIVAIATSVSVATYKSTADIPIVFCAGTDPVLVGLVESVTKPRSRITEVHMALTDTTGKRLELLREMIPKLERVVTFYNPLNRSAIESTREGREAAGRLGVELVERHVSSSQELKAALEALRPGEVDAYLASSDAMVDSQAQMLIDIARTKRLPTMFYQEDVARNGGLSSYGADFYEVGVLAAKYVHRILAGARPGELPVEQMSTLSFVVNLRTAREIHLLIPDSVLARADRLLE